ncbi:MAG: type III secretion system chaperone [Verrucomicrobiota bacterium]
MQNTEENQQKFQDVLRELGEQLGIEDLGPGESGTCTLSLGDNAMVEMEIDTESGDLKFYSEVGTIAEDSARRWYPHLLAANCFWSGTQGSTLGMDPQTGGVFLCHAYPCELLTGEGLYQRLEIFSNTAMFWGRRLLEEPEADVSREAFQEDPLTMMQQRV